VSDAGTATRRFRVFRFKRGDEDWHFDTFEVPVGPASTVLDALRWIQRKLDRSLTIRHSCLHASCGTCGMQVDGREALACVTAVADLGSTVTVEPLANIPVLSDLVLDMTEFYARFPEEIGITRSSEGPAGALPPEDLEGYERFEDCIECGLCLSACPVSATSNEYVGPAALAAAQRLLEEPRGTDPAGILEWAEAPNGAWRCHAAFECTEACPSNVNPAARIMQLRNVLVRGGAKDGAA
jgi:succinate dehydrogenase / fumarate reductase iron-sulfur subunit